MLKKIMKTIGFAALIWKAGVWPNPDALITVKNCLPYSEAKFVTATDYWYTDARGNYRAYTLITWPIDTTSCAAMTPECRSLTSCQ